MNAATVLGLMGSLIDAAAFAAWVGALTSIAFRVTARSPAWHHAAAVSTAVALSALTYFACLMVLGQVALLSGSEGRPPAWGGVMVLAVALGLGIGVPWGMLRHAWWARTAKDGGIDPGAVPRWPAARRLAARFFVPFALLGLLVLAPRVARNEAVAHATGSVIVTVAVAIVLVAVFYTALPHLESILRQAAWAVVVGVPILIVLFVLSGIGLVEAVLLGAGSAVVWGPLVGWLIWAHEGTREAGFQIGRDGLVRPTRFPRPDEESGAETPARSRRDRGRSRGKRRSPRKR